MRSFLLALCLALLFLSTADAKPRRKRRGGRRPRHWHHPHPRPHPRPQPPAPPAPAGPGCDVGEVIFPIGDPSVHHLCDGLYAIGDGSGAFNSMFVVSDEGVILLDASRSFAGVENLVASVTDIPITHIFYPVYHLSHIGGAGLVPGDNIEYVASAETAQYLEETPWLDTAATPLPTLVFEKDYNLVVGNQTLSLHQFELATAEGNSWVHLPHHRVLFAIDLFEAGGDYGWAVNFLTTFTVAPVMRNLAAALALDCNYYGSGHLSRLASREVVALQLQYMEELLDAAIHARETVDYSPAFPAGGLTEENVGHFLPDRLALAAAACVDNMINDKGWGTAPGKMLLGVPERVLRGCDAMGFWVLHVYQ